MSENYSLIFDGNTVLKSLSVGINIADYFRMFIEFDYLKNFSA